MGEVVDYSQESDDGLKLLRETLWNKLKPILKERDRQIARMVDREFQKAVKLEDKEAIRKQLEELERRRVMIQEFYGTKTSPIFRELRAIDVEESRRILKG